jgi:antitoxin (DNA-binding transcriptional repressor) of toxin-antitoxin stability system
VSYGSAVGRRRRSPGLWWGQRSGGARNLGKLVPAKGLDPVEVPLAALGPKWNGLPVAARALAAWHRTAADHERLLSAHAPGVLAAAVNRLVACRAGGRATFAETAACFGVPEQDVRRADRAVRLPLALGPGQPWLSRQSRSHRACRLVLQRAVPVWTREPRRSGRPTHSVPVGRIVIPLDMITTLTMRELGKLSAEQVARIDHPVPVTSNGRPVAWLVPLTASERRRAEMIATGELEPRRREDLDAWRSQPGADSEESTLSEILAAIRRRERT